MSPHDITIHKLCQNPLVRHEAKCMFFLASQRTGKTSGHDLGGGHGALAEICAFLASERIGAGEVTQEQARASACVDPKTFETALQVVRRVTSPSNVLDFKRVTFNSLVRQHAVREDATVAMMEVAQTLNQSGALEGQCITLGSSVVQCAIFHWVCTKVFELAIPDPLVYQHQHKISQKTWKFAQKLLDTHCSHMLGKLAAHAKTAATPSRVTRSQTGTHAALVSSTDPEHTLNNIILRKRGIVGEMKRKTPTEPKGDESPSKRRKGPQTQIRAQTTLKSPVTPACSRKNAQGSVICSEDESEHLPTESIVATFKKKTQAVDISAWEIQRPKSGDMYTTPTKISSSKPLDSQRTDNTPLTTTGMSDVFSDSSPCTQSVPPRTPAKFCLPSLGIPAATSRGLEEETDMPRRRARNLRAAFLDREAYSWKPSARTKEKLERARTLEALIIDRYGDPWDEL